MLITSNYALAQNNSVNSNSVNNNNSNNNKKRGFRPHPPVEYTRASLDKPVIIPNLPKYTGSLIYKSGVSYPKAINSGSYQMNFLSKDSVSEIYNWYKVVLSSGVWTIKAQRNDGMIKAEDSDQNSCIITINPIDKFTKGSKVIIFYSKAYKLH